MRAVTAPSCRIGPGLARPEPCQRPFHNPPARRMRGVQLLLRCVGCAPYSRLAAAPRRRIVIPFVQHRCWGSSSVGRPQWLPGSLQQLGIMHVCSRNHNEGPPSPWTRRLRGTSLANPSGWASGPPKTCLAHRSSGLPFPVQPSHRTPPQGHIRCSTRLHPPLKGAMNGAVAPRIGSIGIRCAAGR